MLFILRNNPVLPTALTARNTLFAIFVTFLPHFIEKGKNGCRVTTSKTDNHFDLDNAFSYQIKAKKLQQRQKRGPQKSKIIFECEKAMLSTCWMVEIYNCCLPVAKVTTG